MSDFDRHHECRSYAVYKAIHRPTCGCIPCREKYIDTLLAEIDRLKAELKNAVEYNNQDFEVIESISKERDRLNAELAEAQDGYTQLQEEYAETVAEARDLPDSIMLARAKATERARCIAAIGVSHMICPECILEATKAIEAPA